MMFITLFFGTLLVAALFSLAKAKQKREARIKDFRAKCFRPESGVQGQRPPRAPRMHGD